VSFPGPSPSPSGLLGNKRLRAGFLPGFIQFAEALLTLKPDGTFAQLYDEAAPLADIVGNLGMKRHVLEIFLKHVWNLPTAPRHSVVQALPKKEIDFQFSHLTRALFRIFGAIVDCSTPDASKFPGGQPVSIYAEILEASEGPLKLTVDTDHPLAACMTFSFWRQNSGVTPPAPPRTWKTSSTTSSRLSNKAPHPS
jgi:hypothetical protein